MQRIAVAESADKLALDEHSRDSVVVELLDDLSLNGISLGHPVNVVCRDVLRKPCKKLLCANTKWTLNPRKNDHAVRGHEGCKRHSREEDDD